MFGSSTFTFLSDSLILLNLKTPLINLNIRAKFLPLYCKTPDTFGGYGDPPYNNGGKTRLSLSYRIRKVDHAQRRRSRRVPYRPYIIMWQNIRHIH